METYEQQLVRQSNENAAWSFRNHVCTLRDGTGRMRRWRCQSPGCWNCGFDVIVIPGTLIVTGDIGFLALERTTNMVAWFSRSTRDLDYLRQKVPPPLGETCREPRAEVLVENLEAHLLDSLRDAAPHKVAVNPETGEEEELDELDLEKAEVPYAEELRRIINQLKAGDLDPIAAYSELVDYEIYDGCDLPGCRAYTSNFLWCVNALRWWLANCDPAELQGGKFTERPKAKGSRLLWIRRVLSHLGRILRGTPKPTCRASSSS